MRTWIWILAIAVLTAGCAGEGASGGTSGLEQEGDTTGDVPLEQRESIEQFDVPALDPTAVEPCELLPDEEARELGILAEEESGSQQTDSNCYFNNRVDISVDVRVSEGTSTDQTVVWHTLAGAFGESGLEEYTEVSGYPGSTTANDDGTACNLDVATSDEHKFTLQVTASKDACEAAVPVAESVVANTPDL